MAVQTLRAEVGIDMTAICRRSGRGIAALAVPIIVDCALVCGSFPQLLASVAVYAQHLERVLVIGAYAVGMLVGLAVILVLYCFCSGDCLALDVSREKDLVAPDNRR